jgi:phospholipid transport system substrate-binding protein
MRSQITLATGRGLILQMWDGIFKLLFYGLPCLLLVCQSTIASARPSAEDIIKRKLEAVFEVLQAPDLDQEAKSQKIIDIVNPIFDFSLMAKLSLGRKYWPELTRDQKNRFTRLFIKRLRASYLDSFTLYTDEKILYEPAVAVKGKIHIPTYLVSKEKKISILYKLYDSGSSWKIYDLEIQGISLIRSFRAQFYEILKSGTIDDLMTKLEG